jgi:uncharacterized membrane protein
MDKISGLPAHPLLVHVPVVLVPLAALGALAMAFWPWLRARIGWIVAGLAVLGGLGALLAASAGESLQESKPENAAISHHAELGDAAKMWGIIFAILVVVFVAGEWWLKRRAAAGTATPSADGSETAAPATTGWKKWALPALAVLTIASGAWATYSVIDAGHTGAKATWQNEGKGRPDGADSRPADQQRGGDDDNG